MKKIKNIAKFFLLFNLIFFSFLIVLSANAQSLVPCGIGPGSADCTLCHLVIGFKNIYDYLLYYVLFPASVMVIVIAGIMYMVSSGNKGLIEKAKTTLVYALSALVLALTAWLLINAVLHALGYRNVGNWWTFTCDTTQSLNAGTLGPGGATLPRSGSAYTPAGNGCAGVVNNIHQMNGWTYTQNTNPSNGPTRMDIGYADCSSSTSRAYTDAGCSSPGGSTADMLSNPKALSISPDQRSSLRAGDLIVRPGHVVMCLDNGCNTVSSAGNGDVHERNYSNDIRSNAKIIRAADFCPEC